MYMYFIINIFSHLICLALRILIYYRDLFFLKSNLNWIQFNLLAILMMQLMIGIFILFIYASSIHNSIWIVFIFAIFLLFLVLQLIIFTLLLTILKICSNSIHSFIASFIYLVSIHWFIHWFIHSSLAIFFHPPHWWMIIDHQK